MGVTLGPVRDAGWAEPSVYCYTHQSLEPSWPMTITLARRKHDGPQFSGQRRAVVHNTPKEEDNTLTYSRTTEEPAVGQHVLFGPSCTY